MIFAGFCVNGFNPLSPTTKPATTSCSRCFERTPHRSMPMASASSLTVMGDFANAESTRRLTTAFSPNTELKIFAKSSLSSALGEKHKIE